jgi:SAM-dependent methyltransferase
MEHQHGPGHGPHDEADLAALAELLDLDGDVLHSYLLDAIAWLRQAAPDLSGGRILDLGAGTGTGTIALAQCFAGADMIAVDKSAQLLARIRAKALDQGFADRVHTVQADLGDAWPAIEPVDVAWAANSLHELTDPGRVLADVFAAIRPGGLLAVTEMDAPPWFLPADIGLGRPGLEVRCRDALDREQADREQAEARPRLGLDWGPDLGRAGFTIVARRVFTIDPTPPLPASAGRYARAYLGRIRPMLDGRVAADDLAALDQLLASDGPGSLLNRDDLTVRGTRTTWLARRP